MVGDDLSIRVVAPGSGNVVDVERLSRGTRDQVALIERLELARLLDPTGGGAPLLLDDCFAHTDEHRLPLALELLAEVAAHRQVIVFTGDRDVVGRRPRGRRRRGRHRASRSRRRAGPPRPRSPCCPPAASTTSSAASTAPGSTCSSRTVSCDRPDDGQPADDRLRERGLAHEARVLDGPPRAGRRVVEIDAGGTFAERAAATTGGDARRARGHLPGLLRCTTGGSASRTS